MGDESDEESASNWVQRSRQKEDVIKREKELSKVGEEFGLGDLVKNEFKEKEKTYSERDLKVCFDLFFILLQMFWCGNVQRTPRTK